MSAISGGFFLKLHTILERYGYSVSQLARLSGVPRRTIANWIEGHVQQPRQRDDVLKIAAALRLNAQDTADLLHSAGFAPDPVRPAQVLPALTDLIAQVTAFVETHNDDFLALEREADNIANALEIALWRRLDVDIGKALNIFLFYLEVRGSAALAEALVERGLDSDFAHRDMQMTYKLRSLKARILQKRGQRLAAREVLLDLLPYAHQQADILALSSILTGIALSITSYPAQELRSYQHKVERSRNSLRDAQKRITVLHNLGVITGIQHDYERSVRYYGEALMLAQAGRYWKMAAAAQNNLGEIAVDMGQADAALEHWQSAFDLSISHDAFSLAGVAANNLGQWYHDYGEVQTALSWYDRGLRLAQETEHDRVAFIIHINLADIALQGDDALAAAAHLSAALPLTDDPDLIALVQHTLTCIENGHAVTLKTDPTYREGFLRLRRA